jgi:hypothetical protein
MGRCSVGAANEPVRWLGPLGPSPSALAPPSAIAQTLEADESTPHRYHHHEEQFEHHGCFFMHLSMVLITMALLRCCVYLCCVAPPAGARKPLRFCPPVVEKPSQLVRTRRVLASGAPVLDDHVARTLSTPLVMPMTIGPSGAIVSAPATRV